MMAKKTANNTEKVAKLLNFEPALIDQITEYQNKYFLPTFTSTVILLITKGLASERNVRGGNND